MLCKETLFQTLVPSITYIPWLAPLCFPFLCRQSHFTLSRFTHGFHRTTWPTAMGILMVSLYLNFSTNFVISQRFPFYKWWCGMCTFTFFMFLLFFMFFVILLFLCWEFGSELYFLLMIFVKVLNLVSMLRYVALIPFCGEKS